MKHKIKVLVVAILCAFMVGCAQSEQPVQQDAQTSQTQQSEVKEDTQTAEQTQKETPEEVLQRCTLKGEWSPELTKLMETINAEHQKIQKPVFSEEKYAKYLKKRENNTISEKAEPNLDGSLSLAQIESDVNFLFDSLRQNYGLYEYFGGEEVFEPARSRVLEQCKEIVHKFNSVYGETLTEPEIILPSNQACLRLPGIDGKAKMSKSLGNCIYLSDEPEEIKKKIMSMFTDPNHLRVEDPGKVEGNPVFIYLDAFCKPEYFEEFWKDYSCLDEVKAHYQRGGLGDVKVKKFLNNVMQEELRPIRERRKQWEQRLPEVYEILQQGSATARATAEKTLEGVRHAMRIDYFSEGGLQSEL